MRTTNIVLLAISVCTVASCSFETPPQATNTQSASSPAAELTRNVSYVGIVGMLDSTATAATHTLALDDASTIWLKASDANLTLSTYAGKRVEVRGSTEPVRSDIGGHQADEEITLMHVEEITVLDASTSSQMSSTRRSCGGITAVACETGFTCVDDLTDDCDPDTGGADCSGVCVPVVASSVSSSLTSSLRSSALLSSSAQRFASSKSSESLALSPSSASVASSSVASSDSVAASIRDLQVPLMAKQDYAKPSLWSKSYCTSHIAFCVSVHKNWYYKSFGATTDALWHVEFGMQPIEELEQGPIVLNLVSGSSAAAGGVSGQVQTIRESVVGYIDWKGDHFEINAPPSLRDAVTVMMKSIVSYTPGS